MFQARVPLKATSHSPVGVAPVASRAPWDVLPAHPPDFPMSESSPATPKAPTLLLLLLVTTVVGPSPKRGVSARSDQEPA